MLQLAALLRKKQPLLSGRIYSDVIRLYPDFSETAYYYTSVLELRDRSLVASVMTEPPKKNMVMYLKSQRTKLVVVVGEKTTNVIVVPTHIVDLL